MNAPPSSPATRAVASCAAPPGARADYAVGERLTARWQGLGLAAQGEWLELQRVRPELWRLAEEAGADAAALLREWDCAADDHQRDWFNTWFEVLALAGYTERQAFVRAAPPARRELIRRGAEHVAFGAALTAAEQPRWRRLDPAGRREWKELTEALGLPAAEQAAWPQLSWPLRRQAVHRCRFGAALRSSFVRGGNGCPPSSSRAGLRRSRSNGCSAAARRAERPPQRAAAASIRRSSRPWPRRRRRRRRPRAVRVAKHPDGEDRGAEDCSDTPRMVRCKFARAAAMGTAVCDVA